MLKKHSRTIGVICGGLNMLPWVIFGVYTLCFPGNAVPYGASDAHIPLRSLAGIASFFPFWFAGLLGSLLLRKKPMLGVTLMLISGVFSFGAAYLYWWAGIPPILLIAAGILAYIAAKTSHGMALKDEDPDRAVKPEKRRHIVKSLSRILGVAGSLPALLLLSYFIIKYLITLYYPGLIPGQEDYPDGHLTENIIAALLLVSALTGSLFVFKKPLLAGLLMILSGIFSLPFMLMALPPFLYDWVVCISAALLAAGVLALAGYNNTPVSPPQNECRETNNQKEA